MISSFVTNERSSCQTYFITSYSRFGCELKALRLCDALKNRMIRGIQQNDPNVCRGYPRLHCPQLMNSRALDFNHSNFFMMLLSQVCAILQALAHSSGTKTSSQLSGVMDEDDADAHRQVSCMALVRPTSSTLGNCSASCQSQAGH